MSISSPPNYGSPDWQRGAYSAQKLLASVPAAKTSVTVNVPPNAEALVIMASLPSVSAPVICGGLQSGRSYIGARAVIPGPPTQDATYFFDVSGTVDTQVLVTLPVASVAAWYVYADAGTRTTMDISNQRSYGGTLYTIPTVPSTVAGDHPLNELQYVGGQISATAPIINAPGVGLRIRVFSAWITCSGTHTALLNESGARWLVACQGGGANSSTFQPTGIALPNNVAVGLVCTTGDNVGYGVSYTVETI